MLERASLGASCTLSPYFANLRRPERSARAALAATGRRLAGRQPRRVRRQRAGSVGVILDSCIWVALAAKTLEPQTVIELAGEAPVFISVMSLGELGFGMQACADPAERAVRAAYLQQLERRPILEVSRHSAAAFGVLAAAVKRAGRSPRPRYNDLWIAAQAIEHGYALMTLNRADFADLPGLRLVTPA
jgi:predicted nucleic acid-binding protein